MYASALILSLCATVAFTHDEDGVYKYHADFLRDSSEAVSFCEEQVDCSNIPGTKCINGTCICETGTCVESEGVKVTKIGEACEETDVCSINNATCVDGKCKCVEGFMASQSERECLEVPDKIGATCTETEQCRATIKHSICSNGTCQCPENRYETNGACRKILKLGDKCTSDAECSKSKFRHCKEGSCGCIERYVSNGSACLLVARDNLSPCEEDVQCTSSLLGAQSTCVNNVCRCLPHHRYHANMRTCVRGTLIGNNCKDDADCQGSTRNDYHLVCSDEQCVCMDGYAKHESQCIPSSADAKIPMISVVLSSVFVLFCLPIAL